MVKTKGQVAQVQQKVDSIEKTLTKEIDGLEQKVEDSNRELKHH